MRQHLAVVVVNRYAPRLPHLRRPKDAAGFCRAAEVVVLNLRTGERTVVRPGFGEYVADRRPDFSADGRGVVVTERGLCVGYVVRHDLATGGTRMLHSQSECEGDPLLRDAAPTPSGGVAYVVSSLDTDTDDVTECLFLPAGEVCPADCCRPRS